MFLHRMLAGVLLLALVCIPALGADDLSCAVEGEPSGADARADSVLVIYNHDSDGTLRRFNCLQRPPFWVQKLQGETIDGRPILFHFPCIRTQTDKVDGTMCERGVCKRAAMIQEVVGNCVARGYRSSNIFLAGYSTGAWASLLVKRANPALVNGVIATAPAFDGKREERFCQTPECRDREARDRGLMRLQHDRWLGGDASARPELNALVLGFYCDPFGYPDEFAFRDNPGVAFEVFPYGIDNPPARGRECTGDNAETRFRVIGDAGETEPAVVCGKISRRERQSPAAPGEPVQCSDKRVAYCDAETAPLCDLKQHKSAHAGKAVEIWFTPLAKNFIVERLAAGGNVENSGAALVDPCGFVKYPASCGR